MVIFFTYLLVPNWENFSLHFGPRNFCMTPFPSLTTINNHLFLLQPATVERRRLTRFRIGHEDNNLCWERHGVDGFISPVDAHNHFRPFYGPPVPWDTYMSWMKNHGILFTTMLGEQIKSISTRVELDIVTILLRILKLFNGGWHSRIESLQVQVL